MTASCVSCGINVNSGDKFCFKCGAKVPQTSVSGRGSTQEEDHASPSSSAQQYHCPNSWPPKRRNIGDSVKQTKASKGKPTTRNTPPKEVLTIEQ